MIVPTLSKRPNTSNAGHTNMDGRAGKIYCRYMTARFGEWMDFPAMPTAGCGPMGEIHDASP